MNITLEQIVTTLLALPAFVPVLVCPGYLAAWLTDLHGFRRRSLAERLFWSLPLSLAADVVLALLSLLACILVFAIEWAQLRRSGRRWTFGVHPIGGTLIVLSL